MFAPPSGGGDGGIALFRAVSSDEDGGNRANIAASGASNWTLGCSRRRLEEEMAE